MLGISLIINIKLHLTSQLQSLLKVTTASVTSSQYPRYQEIALYSNSSSQPQTPANHSPLWTAQTQSHHTFFFLNIVKSNTSPSCTRPTCQTMLRDCSVVHFAGSEERKAKDVKSYSLKCKQLSTFSFNSHSHYRSSTCAAEHSYDPWAFKEACPLSAGYIFIMTTAGLRGNCCHATLAPKTLSIGGWR